MLKTAINFNREKYGLPLYPVSHIKPDDRRVIAHSRMLLERMRKFEQEVFP